MAGSHTKSLTFTFVDGIWKFLKKDDWVADPEAKSGLSDRWVGRLSISVAILKASCLLRRSSFILVTIAGSFPVSQVIDSNGASDGCESWLVRTAC